MPAPNSIAPGAHAELSVAWQFEATLFDLPTGDFESAATSFKSTCGSWSFSIARLQDGEDSRERGGVLAFAVDYGELPAGSLGDLLQVRLKLELLDQSKRRTVGSERFGPGSEPEMNVNAGEPFTGWKLFVDLSSLSSQHTRLHQAFSSQSQYRLSVSLTGGVQQAPGGPEAGLNAPKCRAEQLAALHLLPMLADLRLIFRREGTRDLTLWTSSTGLSALSPELERLVTEAGTDNSPPAKRARSKAPKPDLQKLESAGTSAFEDWQDSDDETDDFIRSSPQLDGDSGVAQGTAPQCRSIDVSEAAYSTVRAVLLYVVSGYLAFAPLRSRRPQAGAAEHGHLAFLAEAGQVAPTLPLPVSPKLVYRLARRLQLRDLQSLALDQLAISLSVEGAATELFSPVAIAYADVRGVVRDFILQNLGAVRATQGWKEQTRKASRGEVKGPAMVMTELFAALAEEV